ncbi:MAG: FAD-binding protein [Phycisphaeraceae bacterium]|nr:FAD-binding protein [Phycisphaeraceae bacterium]
MPQLPVLNNNRSQRFLVHDAPWIADALRVALGPSGGEVRTSLHDRLLYATDASLYQVEPLGVVIPADIGAAERVVRACVDQGVALLPRGGGTSLAGQCTNRAVVVDLSSCCRAVGPVERGDGESERPGDWHGHTAVCEVGVNVDELNEELLRRAAAGECPPLFFAPDPATSRQATVGGCIGNNAAGARSIRYGRTVENLRELEVCLGTGERLWLGPGAGARNETARRLAAGVMEIVGPLGPIIRDRFPRTVRRNAGYALDMILDQIEAGATAQTLDLVPLLAGSEGTLAVTLRARLRLMPAPRAKGLAVISFATIEDAIDAVNPILHAGLPLGLTAVELLDDVVLDAARGNIEYRRYVDLLPGANAATGEPRAVLYIEFFGFESALEVERGFDALRGALARLGGVLPGGAVYHTDSAAMLNAWKLRKAGEPLLHGLGEGGRKPITFVEDNAVPVERLAEFVRGFKEIVGRHGTRAAYWAHASVGVLHVRPMINLHDPADRQRMIDIAIEVADLARACGGIMSGEHGDGRVRGPLLERFFGPELMRAFRRVKSLFDPRGVFNPGNIVAPGPVDSIAANLRLDAEHAPQRGDSRGAAHEGVLPGVETYFDYSDQHGLLGAAEQCNGAGVCRKRSGGVMCPSYMATMDERHSTRGRGNALRLALTGQTERSARPGEPDWDDAATIDTLNLCLSCKGCKSECPSNVDISRLKAEYTAQRCKVAGGPPLVARLFGRVRLLNRLGSMTPGLANRVNRLRVTKWILRRVLGIDPRRDVPRFERSLYSWWRSRSTPMRHADMPRVVLFADCFTAYNEPRIGIAAVRVLEALGYAVDLLPEEGSLGSAGAGCCGRAMISTGLLDDARETIDSTLRAMRPALGDPRVRAVVACEPSCLSAIRDDWLQLRLRTPLEDRMALAAKACLVEEFVDRDWDRHPIRPEFAADSRREVILHAHCHQKALWGAETSARLLRRLAGPRVRVLDSTCCGMAGSFGFAAHRYDLSMRIGELSVLPEARAADDAATICATGTSCRHQIHDGAGREAVHPIELAAELLAP